MKKVLAIALSVVALIALSPSIATAAKGVTCVVAPCRTPLPPAAGKGNSNGTSSRGSKSGSSSSNSNGTSRGTVGGHTLPPVPFSR